MLAVQAVEGRLVVVVVVVVVSAADVVVYQGLQGGLKGGAVGTGEVLQAGQDVHASGGEKEC